MSCSLSLALSKTARFILLLRVRSALNLEISRTDITRTTGAKMGEQVRSASPLSGKRELASAPCQKHFQWDYHKNSLVPAAGAPSRDTFTSMNTKDIQSPLPFTRIRRVFSSQTFVLLLLHSSSRCGGEPLLPSSLWAAASWVWGARCTWPRPDAPSRCWRGRRASPRHARTHDTRKQVHKQPRTYKLNFPCQS